jgi:hypothetical protein
MKGIRIEDDEIAIKNKTMLIDDNRMDIVERVIDSNKGEWKEIPLMGVGIMNMIGSNESDNSLNVYIKEDLERNMIETKNIEIEKGKIDISLEE